MSKAAPNAAVNSDQEVEGLEIERREETQTCWQRFCTTLHHCFENMTDCLNFWCCQKECYNFCCNYNDIDEDDDEIEDAYIKDTDPVVDQAAVSVVSSQIISQVHDRNTHSEEEQSESKIHGDNEGKHRGGHHEADLTLLKHEGNTGDHTRGDHHVGGDLGGSDCRGGNSGGNNFEKGVSGGAVCSGGDSGDGDCEKGVSVGGVCSGGESGGVDCGGGGD